MKWVMTAAGVAGILLVAVIGWSIWGRFMTPPTEFSVAKGVVIVGLTVGILMAGVAHVLREHFWIDPASIDPRPPKKIL